MKKTLVSLMVLSLVLGLFGTGVIARFFDVERSEGNIFAAGTLDLVVTGGALIVPVGPPTMTADWFGVVAQQAMKFELHNIAPGNSGMIRYILANHGTLNGFLDIFGVTITNAPGITPESEPTPDAGELAAHLVVTVILGENTLYSGYLIALPSVFNVNIPLAAGTSTTLVINWELPATVGNIVQGDTVTLGFTVELEQIAD